VADAVNKTVNRTRIAVPRFAYVLVEPLLDPNRFGETAAVIGTVIYGILIAVFKLTGGLHRR